ncbi:hypothetical protein E3N88_19891 [Mikania micrantha]|uniref:Uncharacterized protein n=1 Tax=Mikania micrantha TaxID=192012 RepID=A0A5N6NRV9_9ASTR|nr:hypothetical protein E3N88_19891 [Mikania micrantha]
MNQWVYNGWSVVGVVNRVGGRSVRRVGCGVYGLSRAFAGDWCRWVQLGFRVGRPAVDEWVVGFGIRYTRAALYRSGYPLLGIPLLLVEEIGVLEAAAALASSG